MSNVFGQVGFFQLTNLVKNKVPFLLAKLSQLNEQIPSELNKIIEKATEFESATAVQKIKTEFPDKGSPIVLLCDNGESSIAVAQELVSQGYLNIFVVKKGFEGLLIEVTEGL